MKSNPIIEQAIAIYKPEKDITEISILWSNKINSNDDTYVKIDLEAGTYAVTLIDYNNQKDTETGVLYHKKQRIPGRPSNEVILKTYSSIDDGKSLFLNHELKVPVIQIRRP